MSNYRCKRNRSRSRSPMNKRASRQNRSKDYDRRADSYERHHHPIQSNSQYNNRYPSELISPLDGINRSVLEHSSIIQELLFERQMRQIIEEKLNIREHDYTRLHAQHEQIINDMKLLQHEYDQCRLALKASRIEVNEFRHINHQLQTHINEREQIYPHEELFYQKRQRRY